MTQPEIYPFPKPVPVRNRARQGETDIRVGLYARLSENELEREIAALKPRIDAERKKLEDERAERFGNTSSGNSRK